MIETTTIAAGATSTGDIGPPASGDTLDVTVLGTLVGSIKGGSGADTVTLSTTGSVSGTIDGGVYSNLLSTTYDTLNLTGSGTSSLRGVTGFQSLVVQGGNWSVSDSATFGLISIASGATLNWPNISFTPVYPVYTTGTIEIDGTLQVGNASTLDAYVSGGGKIVVSSGPFTLALESTAADHLGAYRNNSSFSGEIDLNGGVLNLPDGAAGAQIVFGSGIETINTTPAGLASSYTYTALSYASGPQQPTLVNFAAGDQIVVQGALSNVSISADSITYTYQPATTTTTATGTIDFSGLPSGINLAIVSSSSAQTVFGLVTPPPPPSAQQQFAIEAANLFRVPVGSSELTTPTRADGSPNPIYAQEQAALSISSQLTAGTITQTAAQTALYHLVDGTVSVAELSYDFFTGKTVSAAGLNYLVHSTANTSDLDDPYYQQFSTENRYINFAANLGRFGDSSTSVYHAAYDGLSLSDATAKAYQAIFGIAPAAGKVDTILNSMVPDGLGGMETRAAYFAYYGTDGANGVGTKAAMIGWLMSQSVSSTMGLYQNAETNLVADIAHGGGGTSLDLLAFYNLPPSLVGVPTADPTLIGG